MHTQPKLVNVIRHAWGWTGLDPVTVEAVNAFGNVIVKAADGSLWRICPEELGCKIIGRSSTALKVLWSDDLFQRDWQMTPLVEIAAAELGAIGDDRCYCLKIPAVLGGKYVASNIGTNSREELIASSGDLARQIKDMPDGAQVRLRLTP